MNGSQALGITTVSQISDDEMVADLFRLARTGKFKHLEPLAKEAESLFPTEPAERINACLRRLGEILWEADYQGYRTEYLQHRRPKAKGILRRSESH